MSKFDAGQGREVFFADAPVKPWSIDDFAGLDEQTLRAFFIDRSGQELFDICVNATLSIGDVSQDSSTKRAWVQIRSTAEEVRRERIRSVMDQARLIAEKEISELIPTNTRWARLKGILHIGEQK